MRPKEWGAPWWLQIAHIASGKGEAVRLDDRRAVTVLCPLVHDLHVSDANTLPTKWICGVEYPTIDSRHTLWAKQFWDKEHYDPEFLQRYWIGKLPDPEPPPRFWCEKMFEHLGVLW